jgi:parvulin-like peptidyl-prolyl isomerase
LALSFGGACRPSGPDGGPPALAAQINGSALTVPEVSRHFHRRRLEQDGAGGVGREADALLLQQTLADLIERRLLTLAARQQHLAVFSAEVDVAWRQLTHRWDPQALTETLAKLRLSPLAIKEDLRESLLAQKYLRAMVLDRVAVLDRDIEVYLADHPELMVQPEQVRLRHIVVTDAVAAKGVADSLRRGETFADVAAARSLAADGAAGGDLGLVARQALPPEVAQVVFALGVRKLSAPVPLGDGVHLFYVSEKFAQRPLTLAQARPRAEAILRREKESAALAEHLHALRQAANIEPHEVTLEQL